MRVLAVSAHPDDETLGCGGTLLAHADAGDEISWIVATQAHEPEWSSDTIARKAAEVDEVAAAYGAEVTRLGLATTRLDTVAASELMSALAPVIETARPEVVYTVHPGDVHTDHRALYTALMSVLRPPRMRALGVRRVLAFETLSSTDAHAPALAAPFRPTVYRDISPYLERKLEVMALFETETQEDPLPRGPSAIRALARWRGATIGVEYAEAFELIREVGS